MNHSFILLFVWVSGRTASAATSLANVYGVKGDIPPERRSLKNLTLIGTGSDSGNDLEVSSREAQEAQQPLHRPFLPNPHRVSSEREDFPNEAFPSSHADPLSVLAYAGRIVDREGR